VYVGWFIDGDIPRVRRSGDSRWRCRLDGSIGDQSGTGRPLLVEADMTAARDLPHAPTECDDGEIVEALAFHSKLLPHTAADRDHDASLHRVVLIFATAVGGE
jgi:hypothetical protein